MCSVHKPETFDIKIKQVNTSHQTTNPKNNMEKDGENMKVYPH